MNADSEPCQDDKPHNWLSKGRFRVWCSVCRKTANPWFDPVDEK